MQKSPSPRPATATETGMGTMETGTETGTETEMGIAEEIAVGTQLLRLLRKGMEVPCSIKLYQTILPNGRHTSIGIHTDRSMGKNTQGLTPILQRQIQSMCARKRERKRLAASSRYKHQIPDPYFSFFINTCK